MNEDVQDPDVPNVLGWKRKRRTVIEGEEWAESLSAAGITAQVWDERFGFAVENISVQPLQNSWPYLDEARRLIQVALPNQLVAWVYFRIEANDDYCTLQWIEAKPIRRIG